MQRTSSLALDPHARRPRLTSLREQVPLLDLHDPAHPSSSPPWSPSRPPATCGCTGPFVRGATAPQIGATLCRLPRFVRHGRCHSLGRRGCHRGRPRRRHGRVEGRSKPPLLGDDRSANAPPRRRPSLVHERRLRPSISLGRADWIVWVPALVLYAVGAGLAALPQPASRSVWIGLAAWLSAVTLVGESRLLLITLKGPADMHRTRAQSRLVSAASSSLSCECAASPSASKRSLASPSSRVKSPSRQATSRTARSRLSDTTSQACQPRSSTRSVAPPRLSTSPRLRKPRSGAHRRLRREPRRRSSTLTMRATFARRRPARLTSSSTARAPRARVVPLGPPHATARATPPRL